MLKRDLYFAEAQAGLSHREIAKKYNVRRETVSNAISLAVDSGRRKANQGRIRDYSALGRYTPIRDRMLKEF